MNEINEVPRAGVRGSLDPAMAEEYPFIVWWGTRMGSLDSYISDQCREARKDGAPRTAIYRAYGNGWSTIHGITSELAIEHLKRTFGDAVLEDWEGELR